MVVVVVAVVVDVVVVVVVVVVAVVVVVVGHCLPVAGHHVGHGLPVATNLPPIPLPRTLLPPPPLPPRHTVVTCNEHRMRFAYRPLEMQKLS